MLIFLSNFNMGAQTELSTKNTEADVSNGLINVLLKAEIFSVLNAQYRSLELGKCYLKNSWLQRHRRIQKRQNLVGPLYK